MAKPFTIAIKTETSDKKFDVTALFTDMKDGDSHIYLPWNSVALEVGD